MRRPALIAVWVVATALTTVVAWQIVAAAGEQVSPGPRTPVPSTTSSVSPVTTQPTTTSSSSSSSTTTTTTPTTTTTTTDQGSSTSTTTAPTWSVRRVPTAGGTVVLSYRPGEVALDAATPKPGFSVEVKDEGPPEVEVEFEGEELKIKVRAEWEGKLVVEVEEDD